MEGRNSLTVCQSEMQHAIKPYIDGLFGADNAKIESIKQETGGVGDMKSFVITLCDSNKPT